MNLDDDLVRSLIARTHLPAEKRQKDGRRGPEIVSIVCAFDLEYWPCTMDPPAEQGGLTMADTPMKTVPVPAIPVSVLQARVDALKARRDVEPDTTARMIMTVRIDTVEQLIKEAENVP